ncbi:MAG: hypothetical protein KDA57_18515 [Planctomycetales bacterium]|nr:hypothetical protein [Planctomycetales bacterium]
MNVIVALALGAALVATDVGDSSKVGVFPKLAAHNHIGEDQALWECYEFSEAPATSESPIVIAGIDHPLQPNDRKNRTDLQRYWLKENVPAGYKLMSRYSTECNFSLLGAPPLCDTYSYSDPKTGTEHEYYFYLGNWPW